MPKITLGLGKTLLVKGPASIRLVKGKAEIFGYSLDPRKPVVVRPWRMLPISTMEDTELDVNVGEEGVLETVDHNTVPDEWYRLAKQLSDAKGVVAIMGRPDSGKTSFCCLTLNISIREGKNVSLADLDPGQTNICAPTTVGFCKIESPIYELFRLSASIILPVGNTSPTPYSHFHASAVKKIIERASSACTGLIVADCDGWIEGEGALEHKDSILNFLKPLKVILLGEGLEDLENILEDKKVDYEVIPCPQRIEKRDLNARRRLREMAYRKFLTEPYLRTLPIQWLSISTLKEEALGLKTDPAEWFDQILSQAGEEKIKEMIDESEAGLLSYLFDRQGNCLGLGLVTSISKKRGVIRILTPVRSQIYKVVLGEIMLTKYGEEVYVRKGPLTQ